MISFQRIKFHRPLQVDKIFNLKHFSGKIAIFEIWMLFQPFNSISFRNSEVIIWWKYECDCNSPFIFIGLNPSMKWKNNFNAPLNSLNFRISKTFLSRKMFNIVLLWKWFPKSLSLYVIFVRVTDDDELILLTRESNTKTTASNNNEIWKKLATILFFLFALIPLFRRQKNKSRIEYGLNSIYSGSICMCMTNTWCPMWWLNLYNSDWTNFQNRNKKKKKH